MAVAPMKIFITGGTSGIGLGLAESYLKDGHYVAVCGRDIGKLPQHFLIQYPRAKAYATDVTNKDELQNHIREFADGELDLIIANAGISMGSKVKTPNFDISRAIIETNVIGVCNTFEAAFEIMCPLKKGHMVAIASVAGFVGLPGSGAYCGSKAAVLKICESFSLDFKEFGIAVTAVAPGFIKTPLTDKNDHIMPFIISIDEGVLKIKKAILKKKILYVFPLRMKIVIYLLEKMPRFFYRFIMSFKFANYAKGEGEGG